MKYKLTPQDFSNAMLYLWTCSPDDPELHMTYEEQELFSRLFGDRLNEQIADIRENQRRYSLDTKEAAA